MKKFFWKAYLYVPAAILLFLIIYMGGANFENLDEAGLLVLTVFSGALSGFFHVYIVLWEGDKKVKLDHRTMKYCLIFRPPIAMAFTLLCYFWFFHLFLLIREKFPALASVSVVTIGLLVGSFSYWIIKLLARLVGEALRSRNPIENSNKENNVYKFNNGGRIMEANHQEKEEVQGKSLSLKERIIAAGGFWDWIKLIILGFFLLIIPVILVFFIIDFWPVKDTANANAWSDTSMILGLHLAYHLRMLLLVLLAGGLGSYIHVATSFSYHIAKRDFEPRWYWWYWMRIPIGAILALVAIMITSGNLFVAPTGNNDSIPITTIGIAALIGLFSRHAVEKIRDILDVVFNTREKKDDK
ncbi:MAG: hypothetical protein PVH61_09585 [Candidatus Aminicenantes bacterium]|jgi:hypothetical protein